MKTYTEREVKRAWKDYWAKQQYRPSYVEFTWEDFKQHLTQDE
jgi:hypothetical protein